MRAILNPLFVRSQNSMTLHLLSGLSFSSCGVYSALVVLHCALSIIPLLAHLKLNDRLDIRVLSFVLW